MESLVGGFARYQIPLVPAHAVTIHKCQGITAVRGVILFPPKYPKFGLAYVAISRVTQMADLTLVNILKLSHFRCDMKARAKVQAEYERLRSLPEQIT